MDVALRGVEVVVELKGLLAIEQAMAYEIAFWLDSLQHIYCKHYCD